MALRIFILGMGISREMKKCGRAFYTKRPTANRKSLLAIREIAGALNEATFFSKMGREIDLSKRAVCDDLMVGRCKVSVGLKKRPIY
jgi:hypothetical protein